MKDVHGILAADIHIRPDKPECRTDDYFQAIERKIDRIFSRAEQFNCPLYIAGDLGERSTWPNWLLTWFINKVYAYEIQVVIIPGQHDLPGHELSRWRESALGVLAAAGAITLLGTDGKGREGHVFGGEGVKIYPFPFEVPIRQIRKRADDIPCMAMTHQLVTGGKNDLEWEEEKGSTGLALLKKFPGYDLILSGDNHKPFVIEYEGRLLVNPGSMMRSRADQIDHQPRIYLWNINDNTVEEDFLPIEDGVVSREHVEIETERKEKSLAYVKHLKMGYEITLSFKDNMKKALTENRIIKRVKDKINKFMGEDNSDERKRR